MPPPPFSDGIFPCSGCHKDLKVNRTRRTLTDMHTDIVLKHDEEHRWCLDCHDADDRDHLHLASGELVSFDESLPALRAVPRRETARLAGGRARPAHRRVERPQALPALRELPQPAPAALQGHRAEAGARAARAAREVAARTEETLMEAGSKRDARSRARQFASCAAARRGRLRC